MSIWDDIGSVFTGPADVVKDVASFLQWVAWLFNPINWLRAVELILGAVMFGMGLRMAVRQRNPSLGNQVRTFVKDIPGIKLASKVVK